MSTDHRRGSRGFSLVEAMISAAILALSAAGVVTMLTYTVGEAGKTRIRTIAASDAVETLDRVQAIMSVANRHSLTDAQLCTALKEASGPLSTANGGTVAGTCPALTATNLGVGTTSLTRDVTLVQEDIAVGKPGLVVTVTIRSPSLSSPVVVKSHYRR